MFPTIRNQIKSDKSREHKDKVVSLVIGIVFDTGLASFGRVHDMFPKWISIASWIDSSLYGFLPILSMVSNTVFKGPVLRGGDMLWMSDSFKLGCQ